MCAKEHPCLLKITALMSSVIIPQEAETKDMHPKIFKNYKLVSKSRSILTF